MSPTSIGGILIRSIVHVVIIANFESVGNIFTGLGLLAEVNHQLGEEGPRIGLQRLSRFVTCESKSCLEKSTFCSCSERGEAEWLDDSDQSVEETRSWFVFCSS